MNLYEEILYDLYLMCFEKQYSWKDFKNLKTIEKIIYLGMFVSFIFISISYIGTFFKVYIFAVILLLSLALFLSFTIVLLSRTVYFRKNTKNKMRENRRNNLQKFNILLIKYGFKTDNQIKELLESLRLNYAYRRKVKERRHDVFFKYIVTFVLSAIIFVGKEKWERIKSEMSEQYFNMIFEASITMLFILVAVSLYLYIMNRDRFGKDREEKLIKVIEEVLIYRQSIKITLEN
ncbi:hypothetical protein A5821_000267 [Enterococcus sp. 7F3_DIV0205]|uniref:Uncharacterized protein n=1 Tax=Candidatus Enterococcus palustris TaxID=1834189 RepID=A0AAQ3W820_9ENTE